MSLGFSFVILPETAGDGVGWDLYEGDSDKYRSGVEDFPLVGVERLRVTWLDFTVSAIDMYHQCTDGVFEEFLGSYDGNHYVALKPREAIVKRLRDFLPAIENEYCRLKFEVLLDTADAAIEKFGDRAVLWFA